MGMAVGVNVGMLVGAGIAGVAVGVGEAVGTGVGVGTVLLVGAAVAVGTGTPVGTAVAGAGVGVASSGPESPQAAAPATNTIARRRGADAARQFTLNSPFTTESHSLAWEATSLGTGRRTKNPLASVFICPLSRRKDHDNHMGKTDSIAVLVEAVTVADCTVPRDS